MRVAIIRGPGLSKWEMQIYEPLTNSFEIQAIGSTRPVNDIHNIEFPVTKLICPSQYLSNIPRMYQTLFSTTGDTQWLLGLPNALKRVDLAHSVELHNGYTYQAIQAKKKGVVKAVTLTVYENIPFVFDEYPKRKAIKHEVIRLADHFLAVNQMSKEMLLLEGAKEDRISIVPQSVDTKLFRLTVTKDQANLEKLRKRFRIAKGELVLLGVGRLVWEKGWFEILPALAYLKNLGLQFKFLMVGQGPEKMRLTQMVRELGLQKQVVMTDFLPYVVMPDIFRLSDIFIYPTLPTRFWNAQFGGVLIEAMASGLPIITTDSGGARETVGEGGSLFVAPQNFGQLGQAILKLAKDKTLRKKMGSWNRDTAVRKYDVQVVADQIKKIWEKYDQK